MAVGDALGFHIGTYAEYKAKLDATTLIESDFYFTTDTKEMFIGSNKYCEPYSIVETFPESGQVQGIIYINETTYEARVWDGTQWQTVSPAIVETIATETTNDDAVPTVGAVKAYVTGQIGGSAYITSVEDTNTVDLTVSGNALKADVKISATQGNVTLASTTDGLTANAATASNTTAGIIRIATDEEATAGTLENVAVNPKQLLAAKTSATAFRGSFDASVGTYDAIEEAGPRVGDVWAISAAGTVDGTDYNVGDLLYVTAVTPDLAVVKIDNTESADIVRLDQAQTLTNKTIAAGNNTITGLGTTNFDTNAISTAIPGADAVNTKFATEKAVADALAGKQGTITAGDALDLAADVLSVQVDDTTIEVDAGENYLQVKDLGITTAKIADLNVTTAKIADSNVTTAKIADANVTFAKLATDVYSTTIVEGAGDTKLATEKAVKDYVDAQVAGAELEWLSI